MAAFGKGLRLSYNIEEKQRAMGKFTRQEAYRRPTHIMTMSLKRTRPTMLWFTCAVSSKSSWSQVQQYGEVAPLGWLGHDGADLTGGLIHGHTCNLIGSWEMMQTMRGPWLEYWSCDYWRIYFVPKSPSHFLVSMEWATLLYHALPTFMFLLTIVQEQQSQGTMDWNLWNHEPNTSVLL